MSRPGMLPGTDDREDRIVCHVDLDCFYAACERLREPALAGEPVVVGMGYEPGETIGAVATASYEAREHGVESAMPIETALERLPRRAEASEDHVGGLESGGDCTDRDAESTEQDEESAVRDAETTPVTGYYRPVDMEYYEAVSQEIREILGECADTLRIVSIDEAYLDVTARTDWAVAEGFARHVVDRIRREVGLTASVGVAPTMSAAKIASDLEKPAGLVVVEPDELASFLAPLPIERLHGVGPVTANRLADLGFETVGDVAAADASELEEHFGERGVDLHRQARGADDRAVTPRGRPKSLSRESSLGDPRPDHERHRERITALARDVAERARAEGALYRTIGIKVVTPPYDVNTREESLSGPVEDPALLEAIALELLEEFADRPIRKLGVRVSNLEFTGAEQASLESWDEVPTAEGQTDGEHATRSSRNAHSSRHATDSSARGSLEIDGRPHHHGLPVGQTRLTDFPR